MTAPEPTPTAEHIDAVALERRHREAGAECALWNQANLVGQAIDRGRLDGTDGAAVAAAIRARTPEEFAKACGEVSPTAEHIDAVALDLDVTEASIYLAANELNEVSLTVLAPRIDAHGNVTSVTLLCPVCTEHVDHECPPATLGGSS